MMRIFFLALILLSDVAVHAQQQSKLVVGIVIDQMRQDYLYRYWSRFGEGGFKRLVNGGYMFENAQYNYVPTYTAPGHASIYTGTVPAIHGIVANNWYKRDRDTSIYCVDDTAYRDIGGDGRGVSPQNLKTTTITDQLRLATNFRSKVIALSIKDRGAALPGGHTANAAYWFDPKSGIFTSSSFYMEVLPLWMQQFNSKKLPDTYMQNRWETLYPIDTYTASAADDNDYEGTFEKDARPVFPYDLKKYKDSKGYSVLSYTPYSNTLLAEAAKAAMEGEQLGRGKETDFLCVSFSATDYAGHFFGPQAVELEDMYLRLDKELSDLFAYLDKTVGKGAWTLFLTADHGGNDVPALLAEHNVLAGIIQAKNIEKTVKTALKNKYGDSLVLAYENEQLYLDKEKIEKLLLNKAEVEDYTGKISASFPGVARYYTASRFAQGISGTLDAEKSLYNGWNPKESGDVLLLTEPGWMDHGPKGTTHGSPWAYDTRVPVIFYGAGIKQGKSAEKISITDIAPTLSILLRIQFPNGCTGTVLNEVLAGY